MNYNQDGKLESQYNSLVSLRFKMVEELGIEVYPTKQQSTNLGGSHAHITKIICRSQSDAEHILETSHKC